MTAGQVADKTGLARGTVSTTLSKLAKSGEVQKAERGYRIAATATPSEAASPAPAPSSRRAGLPVRRPPVRPPEVEPLVRAPIHAPPSKPTR